MDVQREKTLKGKSQTILFTGRALTSTTRGKYTVNLAPQIPTIPKNTEHTEKSGKAQRLEQKTPPSKSSSWGSTPYFRGGVEYDTSFPPNFLQTLDKVCKRCAGKLSYSTSTTLQASDGGIFAFDAGETENKV